MHFLSILICLTLTFALPAKARGLDDYPTAQLRALDKITARTLTFETSVGSTVQFGSLYIKVRACRKAPPIAPPESTAFLQIWEAGDQAKNTKAPTENYKKKEAGWVYSGWMFASSPAISAMDHPIYDVWVLDCLNEAQNTDQTEEAITDGEKAPPAPALPQT